MLKEDESSWMCYTYYNILYLHTVYTFVYQSLVLTLVITLLFTSSGDLTTDLCHLNHYRTPNASGLECQPGESTCECQYQVPRLSRYNVVRNADVTFTITVKRVRWQVDVDKTVNLINHSE